MLFPLLQILYRRILRGTAIGICSVPAPAACFSTAATAPVCCCLFSGQGWALSFCRTFWLSAYWCDAFVKAHTAWSSNKLCPLQDFLAERLLLDAIVTVVDAKHIEQHLDDKKPEGVENEVCLTITLVSQKVRWYKEASLILLVPENFRCACATTVRKFHSCIWQHHSCWECMRRGRLRLCL